MFFANSGRPILKAILLMECCYMDGIDLMKHTTLYDDIKESIGIPPWKKDKGQQTQDN